MQNPAEQKLPNYLSMRELNNRILNLALRSPPFPHPRGISHRHTHTHRDEQTCLEEEEEEVGSRSFPRASVALEFFNLNPERVGVRELPSFSFSTRPLSIFQNRGGRSPFYTRDTSLAQSKLAFSKEQIQFSARAIYI